MNHKVLLVDDEENILDVCSRYLEREDYRVMTASNGRDALKQYEAFQPDLVVLDVMMPEMNGWKVAEAIRQKNETPIIMLTALGQEQDRIYGLTIGADDYITKPFSPRELLLRIKNILRRTYVYSDKRKSEDLIISGVLTIDIGKRLVMISKKEIDLTIKEFDILALLAQHPSQVFSKTHLLEKLWGYAYDGDANTINVHIRRLREKIENNPSKPIFIKTVWGIGYKFEGDHKNEA
ncbi:response regulator transcription factor [Jeotgalibacillus marinus]|uniref:Response regulator transcription factor n=1 Tax=Jeotgalibacillus marinus TaxID=86667 RepID=A0ABV3Q6Q4_9BACL